MTDRRVFDQSLQHTAPVGVASQFESFTGLREGGDDEVGVLGRKTFDTFLDDVVTFVWGAKMKK